MAKTIDEQAPPATLPGEFGPIGAKEYFALPEDVRMRRAKRAHEKLMKLERPIDLKIDIDELRGRNR